jgi:hypothetical protein
MITFGILAELDSSPVLTNFELRFKVKCPKSIQIDATPLDRRKRVWGRDCLSYS